MVNESNGLYEFDPFRLDAAQRLLLRNDCPIPLQPKAFETLLVLVRNSEKVVLRDDLLNAVWADTFVQESNLTQNIFVLRKALGEHDGGRRYIITVPGRGYRFAEKVWTLPEAEEGAPEGQPAVPPIDGGESLAGPKETVRERGPSRKSFSPWPWRLWSWSWRWPSLATYVCTAGLSSLTKTPWCSPTLPTPPETRCSMARCGGTFHPTGAVAFSELTF
jgi:DNA-binding winged helix-turn-helix (wHTH) protein